MRDGTRLIFWIDLLVLLALIALVASGQWDLVIAVVIALVIMNYFDHWWSRHRPQP